MPLNIEATWQPPLDINPVPGEFSFVCRDIENVPEGPGVYIFGRRYGDTITPCYIGRSRNINGRLKQHLNSIRLMNGLRNFGNGQKIFSWANINLRPGQNIDRILHVLERMLIVHATDDGHELLNVNGARLPHHVAELNGNREISNIFSRSIRLMAINV